MEYIEMDYIRDIVDDIEPRSCDYAYQGVAECMVLDKRQEIADMLKELEQYVIDIDEELIGE